MYKRLSEVYKNPSQLNHNSFYFPKPENLLKLAIKYVAEYILYL